MHTQMCLVLNKCNINQSIYEFLKSITFSSKMYWYVVTFIAFIAFNLWTCLHLSVNCSVFVCRLTWPDPVPCRDRVTTLSLPSIVSPCHAYFRDHKCVCVTYFCLWIYFTVTNTDIHLCVHWNVFVRRESFIYKSQNTFVNPSLCIHY